MNKLKTITVERGKLTDVLRGLGNYRADAVDIQDGKLPVKLRVPQVAVGYIDGHFDPLPKFLVIPGTDRREFFAWVNTYCPFVTPLSQWCRVISEEELVRVQSLEVIPRYGNFASAWAGAVVGEAILNVGIGNTPSQLPVAALQSCTSFVAARAFGLWGSGNISTVSMSQYEIARDIFENTNRNSDCLEYHKLWEVLGILSNNGMTHDSRTSLSTQLMIQSCKDIQKSDFVSRSVMFQIIKELVWPEKIVEFEKSGSEQRIVIFDNAVERLIQSRSDTPKDLKILGEFAVAYLAARIGGSASSHIALLEKLVKSYPMMALWYGVVSALYRSEVWGAEFGGLGRLALKELSFPLRFDDPPRCDIAFDELIALVGPNNNSQSLRFRGATHRALNIEVSLGVNAMIRLSSLSEHNSMPASSEVIQSEIEDLLRHLGAAVESARRLDNAHGSISLSRSPKNQNQTKKKRPQSRKSQPRSRNKARKSKVGSDRELSHPDSSSVKSSQMELVE